MILPLTVLRRLDCVLEPTKAQVLETAARLQGKVDNVSPVLENAAGEQFYNTSKLDLRKTGDDDSAFWWRHPTGTEAVTDDREQQRIIRRRFGSGNA